MSPSLLSLPQAQVDKFKMQMIQASGHEDWPAHLISAGNNKEALRKVFISVLGALAWIVMLEAALQKSIIVLAMSQAREFVQSLNDCEVEEWKNLVQNGDWVGLITHCTSFLTSNDIYLYLVLAQQNFRNQLS
jgi:hypothetical protein